MSGSGVHLVIEPPHYGGHSYRTIRAGTSVTGADILVEMAISENGKVTGAVRLPLSSSDTRRIAALLTAAADEAEL